MKKYFYFLIAVTLLLSLFSGGLTGMAASVEQADVVVEITADSAAYSSGQQADIRYAVYSNIMDPGKEIRNVVITATADAALAQVGVKSSVETVESLAFGSPATDRVRTSATDIVFDEETAAAADAMAQSAAKAKGLVLWVVLGAVVILAVVGLAVLRNRRAHLSTLLALALVLSCTATAHPAFAATTEAAHCVTKEVTVTVDGKPCTYTVDVTYDLVVNDKVHYYEDNRKSNAVKNDAPTGLVTIENEYIRLGVNLSFGGAVTLLQSVEGGISEDTENIINSYDWGRQIQMSMYSGPTPYYKPDHAEAPDRWKHLGWNPIQAGDVGEYNSRILAYYNDGECIYVKCRPMHWPQVDMPGECTYEVLYTLVGNRVDVRCRMVNQREDFTDEEYQKILDTYYTGATTIDDIRNTRQFPARSQELPAVYTNGNFCNLIAYTGTNPFQNEALTTLFNASTPKEETESWRRYTATENWMALVNNADYGLGIYNSATSDFSCGFVGEKANPSSCSEKDMSTGYIGPKTNEILDHNIVYDYNYTLVVGTVDQIRKGVYEVARVDHEDYTFDFSENRDGWYYPQNTAKQYITDAGYGNQSCLDFDFFAGGSLSSNANYWRTDAFNTVQVDGAFTNATADSIRVDVVLTMYNGAQQADGVTAETVTVPLIVTGDGQRRTYTLELSDIYEYQNGLGCTALRLNFLSAGSAEIYSIGLK